MEIIRFGGTINLVDCKQIWPERKDVPIPLDLSDDESMIIRQGTLDWQQSARMTNLPDGTPIVYDSMAQLAGIVSARFPQIKRVFLVV